MDSKTFCPQQITIHLGFDLSPKQQICTASKSVLIFDLDGSPSQQDRVAFIAQQSTDTTRDEVHTRAMDVVA